MKLMKTQANSSRQEILDKIAVVRKKRPAIFDSKSKNTASIYKPIQPNLLSCFIQELEAVNGQCVVCENKSDLFTQLKSLLEKRNINVLFCQDTLLSEQLKENEILVTNDEAKFYNMQVGITTCEYLVARTGSVIISSFTSSAKKMNVFPPVHIVIAKASQLVEFVEDALVLVQQKYETTLPAVISIITGPSRTADIEKTLVLGAHGPKEFIVFLSKE